jgi:hypothetical protein
MNPGDRAVSAGVAHSSGGGAMRGVSYLDTVQK